VIETGNNKKAKKKSKRKREQNLSKRIVAEVAELYRDIVERSREGLMTSGEILNEHELNCQKLEKEVKRVGGR